MNRKLSNTWYSTVEYIEKSSSFRRQLEKQAKLVLSENEVLMERQELQNKKLEEVTAFYKGEGIWNMHVVGVVLKFIFTAWCNP